MTKKVLTDKGVQNLKPALPGQRYIIGDVIVPGLGVRVTESGHKSFVLGARYPGSPHFKRRELAAVGAIGLAEARDKARLWLGEIKAGRDPRDAEREREASRTIAAITFADVADDYIKRALPDQRKGKTVERELRREVLPTLGPRPFAEITRREIVELIETIAARGETGAHARNILAHLKTLYNWAIERELYGLEVAPTDRIKSKNLLGEPRIRTRVLNDDEIRSLWRAASRVAYPWGPLIQLLFLTGCRLSEVAEARWGEFSQTTFTIPSERYKSGEVHIVPLTEPMKALLSTLPRWKSAEYLFSSTDGSKPIHGLHVCAKSRLDRQMMLTWRALDRNNRRGTAPENWSPHDLRRTMRTRLGALRVPENIAEMTIGHAKKGLMRIYDQHRYETEIRDALTAWNNLLESIVNPSPSNVIALRAAS